MTPKRVLQLTMLMVALGSPLAGQTTTGAIRGDVRDSGGAPLPGVSITVTGERGVERVAVSGENGSYLINAVPPGNYSIDAALDGMGTQRAENVRVTIGGYSTIDFTLSAATVAEQITVTADAPLLDLRSSEAPTNFEAEFIEDIPTRRSFWDMFSVSPGISGGTEFTNQSSAYGSGTSSNSWSVDGLNVTGPETGRAWWYINPETIGEVQVLGIGASAEYGNMTGAAINVVTKSGGNEFAGTFNSFLQFDELTDENVEIDGIPYHRDKYHNETLTFGGPIVRDKAWFFLAGEYYIDSETLPGTDPSTPAEYYWERYDGKFDWALAEGSRLDAKYHYEDYKYDESSSPYVTPSARGSEFGTNPAWGIGYTHTFSAKTLFEAHYAGWEGKDYWHSSTGSTEDAYVDFSPPGGGPPLSSGGLAYPYDYELEMHQADIKMSRYADDFLGGDHDFRFGVQYSYGVADTISKAGSGGDYYYHYTYQYYDYYSGEYIPYEYYYKYTWTPFHYGNKQRSLSAFVQDSWRVNDRLTFNLGVRYDVHEGWIPDYDRLDENSNSTGVTIPGRDNVIDWKVFSPRLGFAWTATEDARTVLRGSVGIYHDGNVGGNWNYPPPDAPPLNFFYCAGPPPTTCDDEPFLVDLPAQVGIDPDLNPPKSTQYALGLERQLNETMAAGVQVIYKDTEDLIGWEILGDGIYEPVEFEDPVTGEVHTLLNVCDEGCRAPTIRKGNRPGAGSLAPNEDYHSDYRAAILTLERRQRDGWSFMASYTWSRSEGLIPRPKSQLQGNPFFFSLESSDPNEWLNAEQLLQNDREHMFRMQGTAEMAWGLELTGSINWQSGRPYNRQARTPSGLLGQGRQWIIMDPNSDDRRLPSTLMIDLGFGKRWQLGNDLVLKTDLQVLNALNDDEHQYWETQQLLPGEDYVKDDYLYPRRFMIRLGLEF